MGILEQLSKKGATDRAAQECLAEPRLVGEVVQGFASKDALVAGNCAEAMTKIAQREPALVAAHAPALLALLAHRNGRVRWESAHALALVASLAPKAIEKALPTLEEIVRADDSVIVRDYCLDALAGCGGTGPKAAAKVLPVLVEALDAWDSRHAARVLGGLGRLAAADARLAGAIRKQAQRFAAHERPGVCKAAQALLRALAKVEG